MPPKKTIAHTKESLLAQRFIDFATKLVSVVADDSKKKMDELYSTDPEMLRIAPVMPLCTPAAVGQAIIQNPVNIGPMLAAFDNFDGLFTVDQLKHHIAILEDSTADTPALVAVCDRIRAIQAR